MTSLFARTVAIAVALAVALPMGGAGAAEPVPLDTVAVDDFVRAQMDKHRVPGLALAVIDQGEVTHLAGFGDAGGGRSVTPDTPFVLGSISKSFTAVAVLQLAEQGLVELDAAVAVYLPGFAVADEKATAAITVRHLLSHTSGLSELGYNRVLARDTTLEQAVADLRRARPTAPVGARFQYFNQGYSVLALLVQTVSGQPFGTYVTQHVFEPLSMTRSFVDRGQAITAGLAQGHSKIFGFPLARELPHSDYALGYGHLISTAHDLSRFASAMAHDGTHDDATILTPDSVEIMRTVPAGVPDTTYGLGWSAWEHDGIAFEGHAGGGETFMTSLTLLPEQDSGFVWLMNQEHFLDPVRSQLDAGLTALLLGTVPETGGMSMRWLGLGLLAAVLIAPTFAIGSTLSLRSWVERSRGMSTGAIVRRIAPHVAVPAIVVWVIYHYLGPLFLGQPVAWNFRYVGSYFFPEVALLLILAVVPDLLQALYMTATVTVERLVRSRDSGQPSPPEPDDPSPPLTASVSTAGQRVGGGMAGWPRVRPAPRSRCPPRCSGPARSARSAAPGPWRRRPGAAPSSPSRTWNTDRRACTRGGTTRTGDIDDGRNPRATLRSG